MNDNSTKSNFLTQTLDGRLFSIAAQYPDNLAYVDNENSVTYRQLYSKIEHIAAVIQKNFADEDIIGLYFDQSLEFIVCFFAVIRAGKISVPLDIKSPENCLVRLAHNAKIKVIIKGDDFIDFNIDELNVISYKYLNQKEEGQLQLSEDINKEAIVLYTSGSTGEPKGVIHTHKSLMHHTYRFKKLLNVNEKDRCTLLYCTAYFGGIRDVLSALLNGASLHYYSIEKNGYADLPKWLTKNKITIYTSVITVYRHLCDAIEKDLKHIDLRAVRIGSDVCLKSDFEKYKAYFPDHCVFVSGLASSETGLIRQNVLTKDAIVIDNVSNGYPVEDVDIYIKDDEGNNLAEGEIGTLVISSDYLSLGYKNMPELTEEKYKIDPISGKREFWSGDVGYIKDGYLFFAGRKDTQVKMSGRRIDLSEIDAVIMDLKGVINSVSLYYEETKSIVLFVEVSKNSSIFKEEIRKYLADNLPFYMQPTRIILLSGFPLGSSFKVNKKELYELIKNHDHPHVEPTNEFETEIIHVWKKVLDKDKIGIHDNFFELGGDSISATTVSVLLENKYNIKIPYGYLYRAQTVQALAQAIETNNFHKELKWLNLINQGSGNSIPIYWVGEESIRKYLPDDQTIYRVSTHYDHGTLDTSLTVESICSEFVKEILQVNRGNHCIVGGFSMGARYALEMAQQLKKSDMNVDLLILLDPSEDRDRNKLAIGNIVKGLISNCFLWADITPPKFYKNIHVYQFHKILRKNYKISKYDGKVLLFQRRLKKVPFEIRDWPKITEPSNLIFYDLEVGDHFEVVSNPDIQLEWTRKIKEHIY